MTSERGADEATRDALARGREIGAAKAPAQNATAPETPAPKTGLFSALEMDVHFVAPDNLVVRGNDIRPGGRARPPIGSSNATLGADLQLTKAVDGPVTIRGNGQHGARASTSSRDGGSRSSAAARCGSSGCRI